MGLNDPEDYTAGRAPPGEPRNGWHEAIGDEEEPETGCRQDTPG